MDGEGCAESAMPRHLRCSLTVILSLFARSLVGQAEAQPAAVAPELLPQGFILVAEDRSGLTSESSPLYLASNHGGWNPGNPAMKMTRRSDSRWQIEVPHPADSS